MQAMELSGRRSVQMTAVGRSWSQVGSVIYVRLYRSRIDDHRSVRKHIGKEYVMRIFKLYAEVGSNSKFVVLTN
jgi:hypothetical protein